MGGKPPHSGPEVPLDGVALRRASADLGADMVRVTPIGVLGPEREQCQGRAARYASFRVASGWRQVITGPSLRHQHEHHQPEALKEEEDSWSMRAHTPPSELSGESTAGLLRELVAHLRQNRTQLREEWVRRITAAQLLTAMTREEIFAEATSVYDSYVEALETGHGGGAAGVLAQPLRAHHPARRRDERGRRDRAPPARRARALAVREVPRRLCAC